MPSYPNGTPPPWNEADSFRETGLIGIDDPEDREAVRRVSRLIFDMSLEVTREVKGESSVTRAEMRAALADLRYLEGYLVMVGREAEESSLPAADNALAVFAGKLAGQLGAIAQAIERELQ
jgi:hypothetical protein